MLEFYKYQGTGNDFVIIDNRKNTFDGSDEKLVNFLCDRRFGIGADGLMLLENHDTLDFTMRYYNSDGKEASMCGNGGRCIAAFAVHIGVISNPEDFTFMAVDGEHEASYKDGIVSLKMIDVNEISSKDSYFFLNTGSPHYVRFCKHLEQFDVVKEGAQVRYSDVFKPGGTNANFVEELSDNHISVRTYERGVEDETLACGTGVVASAISAHLNGNAATDYNITVKGGELQVRFERVDEQSFKNIWLIGPAKQVFKGTITIS